MSELLTQSNHIEIEVTKFKHLARRAKSSRNASLYAMKQELAPYLPATSNKDALA